MEEKKKENLVLACGTCGKILMDAEEFKHFNGTAPMSSALHNLETGHSMENVIADDADKIKEAYAKLKLKEVV